MPVPHSGPPMAPRRTAEADLAAVRASSVRGVPWASMEHWGPSLLVAECVGVGMWVEGSVGDLRRP